jgi:hypothetical protein
MDLREEIKRAAYYLYEKGGWMHGKDTEHWYEAERMVTDALKKGGKVVRRVRVKAAAAPRPSGQRKKAVGRQGKPRLGVKTRP